LIAEPRVITGSGSQNTYYYASDQDLSGNFVTCGKVLSGTNNNLGVMAMWDKDGTPLWYKYYSMPAGFKFYFT